MNCLSNDRHIETAGDCRGIVSLSLSLWCLSLPCSKRGGKNYKWGSKGPLWQLVVSGLLLHDEEEEHGQFLTTSLIGVRGQALSSTPQRQRKCLLILGSNNHLSSVLLMESRSSLWLNTITLVLYWTTCWNGTDCLNTKTQQRYILFKVFIFF